MKLAILLFVGLCSAAYAAAGSGTWNNVPDIADRAFWETQKSRPGMSILLKRAEEEVKTPRESPLPHYLDFRNTGNRTIYQKKFLELYRIAPLTLASCVTGEKRFIEALENRVRTVAGLPTWVLPAHDPALKNYRGETVEIDLGAAAAGTELVCALALLEPAMTPDTARLLRSELMRRIVIPLEEMMEGSRKEAWWLNTKSNWNSVCISGMAAIVLRIGLDVPRREKLLSFLLKRSENFLKGFGSDGYCSEGISYWFYGFGYYLRMAADVYQATGGKIRLTERSDVRLPAAFAEKFLLAPRVYPAFADADPDARPNRFVLNLRNWLYGGSAGFPRNIMLSNGLQDLCLMLSLPQTEQRTADAVRLPALSQFRDAGVFLVRPGDSASRLAVAFKGGSNAEFHNHNDVGSYVIAVDGVPVAVDPGREIYSRRSFGSRRYECLLANSFGHSVPKIAGKLQTHQGKTKAALLGAHETEFGFEAVFDITPAYHHIPELRKLVRRFGCSRENAGRFLVEDCAEFHVEEEYENAVISFGKFKRVDARTFLIVEKGKTLKLEIDCDHPFAASMDVIRENTAHKRDVNRLAIRTTGKVSILRMRLIFTPEV